MREIDNFYLITINHKKASSKEISDFIKLKKTTAMDGFMNLGIISGYIALNTCLRSDLYFYMDNPGKLDMIIEEFYYTNYNISIYKGENAVFYLFKLICGLNSIIVGEEQILSQVKKSFIKYLKVGKTCGTLNTIFNNAISLGKKFRCESQICRNSLSIESISIKLLKKYYGDIRNKKIFVIGTGDLSKSILRILKNEEIQDVSVTNRSKCNLNAINTGLNANKVDYVEKYETVKKSDIIISTTSAPHYVLSGKELKESINDGKERFFIDLAVPKDIDESIKNQAKIILINLDDIWNEYRRNSEARNIISNNFSYLIEEQKEKCMKWFIKKN